MIDVVITGLERVQAMVDPVVFEMKLAVAIDLWGQRADRADPLGDPVAAIRRGLTVDGAGPAREDCVINFYLYAKASRQFAAFHLSLERIHRFHLANSLCENLKNQDHKGEARCALIDLIAQAPMVTEDVISAGGAGPRRRKHAARPKVAQD